MRKFLAAMRNHPPIAVELWDGERISACKGPPEVVLHIKSRGALWGIVTNPDLYFGDAYIVGAVEVEGRLLRLIELASNNRPDFIKESTWFGKLMGLVAGAPRVNTPEDAIENIHHHYDVSNEFYQLWLDRDHMQYTCAYYDHPDATVEEAQTAKLHHVCRKLRLKPGDRVLEAGCGWGGLARFMAREYGAHVRAYNISHQQLVFARDTARAEGLDELVEYREADYRDATGEYDVFVSVGMLEHVGKANYRELGGVVDRCLTAEGRGLIHTIGRNRPRVMNRWIEKRIFPGAYPPTLGEMSEIFEPYDFSVLDVENLRLHYERTLDDWRQCFEASRDTVREMFDERFVRAWRLYLEGSIHAFRNGDLQLFQIVFQRGRNNDVPWTREHLYRHDR
jgi:cyclopropane-fatty-acyl-phospholipid synthase